MYKIKFMFDWGSGICMWSADKKTEEKFGDYPIETDLLPISEKLIDTLNKLIDWHDEALNWESPSEDLIWDDNQIQQFLMAAKVAYNDLCNELGDDYEIAFYECM